MSTNDDINMNGTKLFLQTILFSSVPLFLKDITPYFAFISAFFGSIMILHKFYHRLVKPKTNDFIKWRKNKVKDS